MSDRPTPDPRTSEPSPARPPAAATVPPVAPPPRRRWIQVAGSVLFALICLELGVLLVIGPWLDFYDRNLLFSLKPEWRPFFLHPAFRGALNGLGFMNFFIALNEIVDLLRPRRVAS